MIREEHVLNEIHAYRYCGEDPKYALIISHGIASHGAIYDIFCGHHAARGVDIWSFDAPGHGKSTTNRPRGQWTMAEWADAAAMYAEHVKKLTGLPVFTLGSSLGVAAAYSALYSDAITGGILMGSPAVPGGAALRRQRPYGSRSRCRRCWTLSVGQRDWIAAFCLTLMRIMATQVQESRSGLIHGTHGATTFRRGRHCLLMNPECLFQKTRNPFWSPAERRTPVFHQR